MHILSLCYVYSIVLLIYTPPNNCNFFLPHHESLLMILKSISNVQCIRINLIRILEGLKGVL